jgi:hypothetical protein
LLQQSRGGGFGGWSIGFGAIGECSIDDHDHGEMSFPSTTMVTLNKNRTTTSSYTISSRFYRVISNFGSTTTWKLVGKPWWCREKGKVDRN